MSYLHHNHPGNGVENCHHEEDETGSNAKCLGVDGVKDGSTDHQAQHFNTGDCSKHCACIDTKKTEISAGIDRYLRCGFVCTLYW